VQISGSGGGAPGREGGLSKPVSGQQERKGNAKSKKHEKDTDQKKNQRKTNEMEDVRKKTKVPVQRKCRTLHGRPPAEKKRAAGRGGSGSEVSS